MSQADTFRERASARRDQHRLKLSRLYLPYYDALCEFLGRDSFWYPFQGMRTLSEQGALYEQGRTDESKAKGLKIVTQAMPGDSAHNWGCATDWVEFRPGWDTGEIWAKSNWQLYGECVRKAGLQWGGLWKKFPDRPHNELPITCTWKRVGDEFRKNGGADIKEFIADHMKHLGIKESKIL